MHTTDPPGSLQEGMEPAPPPQIGPDGGPLIEARRTLVPARPRLCEAGPCRHYHRLEIQVDAENPRAQKLPVRLPVLAPGMEATPDGTIYRAPAVYHTAVEHYCYPDTGIEMPLGATPVVQCNRWEPKATAPMSATDAFWTSPQGRAYAVSVQDWEAAREREAQESAHAERLLEESLRAQDEPPELLPDPEGDPL